MLCPVCGSAVAIALVVDDDPDELEHADRQAWLDAEEDALLREARRGEQ
jgi:hypothetical protein